jgi:hypothetical protein
MAPNPGLDLSFDNVQGSKGIRKETREVTSTKVCITNDEMLLLLQNFSCICKASVRNTSLLLSDVILLPNCMDLVPS